jgi:cytoskeletal protein CcmA (bactofilin family)
MALYMEDNNKPLVLVGNTTVKGLAFLPQRGVKSGNISGHSYYGSQLIYGNTKTSKALPELVSETLQQLERISENIAIEEHRFLDLNQSEVLENSFLQPYQLVYSPSSILLSHKTLTGHIIVQSHTEIVVENSANLKDVILVAPKITVQDGVKGAFQAFATESIYIGSNCYLGYPSALVVTIDGLQPETQPTSLAQELISPIHIQSDTVVKGAIVFTTNQPATTYEPHMVIDEKATVYGEVYCNANLELKGVVYGSVFTSNFIAKQFGSVYQNHLYNATIIVDSLQQEYVGLTFKDSKKDIIKWLY